MASIRIVDDWLRSPASPPSHYRSVMVIAEKWGEQRVLMRAYAESRDQLRPTITLHGIELAIGPAGLDMNGSWGIHVGEPSDGRAQEIKEQLEAAARRLAGSKGNPPRLADEEPTFDREPTANWGPGAPRMLPKRNEHQAAPQIDYVHQVGAARVPQAQAATMIAHAPAHVAHHVPMQQEMRAPSNPEVRQAPVPRQRRLTRQPVGGNRGTALGFASGSGAQSAIVRLGLVPHISARLGRFVDRVVPQDFHIDAQERRVLNALGEGQLTARAIGQMLNLSDAVSFMEELTRKLESYSLDLVEPGDPMGGEPTYRLRG
ncbi:MAG: hypothetical protein M4D80_32385 [Myxococcota bacterium]|nr:hypothetical protein [Myxococcota bacterium]